MVVGVVAITALPCSDELICPGSHGQSASPRKPHPQLTHELARVALGTLAAACQTCCLAVARTRRWYPQAACGHSQPPPVVTFLRAAAQHTTAAHLPRKNCPSTADSAESSPPAPGSSRKPPTNSKHARCTVGGATAQHTTVRLLATSHTAPCQTCKIDNQRRLDRCGPMWVQLVGSVDAGLDIPVQPLHSHRERERTQPQQHGTRARRRLSWPPLPCARAGPGAATRHHRRKRTAHRQSWLESLGCVCSPHRTAHRLWSCCGVTAMLGSRLGWRSRALLAPWPSASSEAKRSTGW